MYRERRLLTSLCYLGHAVPQLAAALVLCLLAVGATNAQQINGVPGSAGATVTLDGKQLPPSPMKRGVTRFGAKRSPVSRQRWWLRKLDLLTKWHGFPALTSRECFMAQQSRPPRRTFATLFFPLVGRD